MQQSSKVYFNIARIGAECLVSSAFAEAAGLKIVQQLLSQIGDQAFEPAADSSFVNMKDARDLQQSLSIEKVRREQEAIFGRKSLKRLRDRVSEVLQLIRDRSGDRRRRRDVELVQRSLPVRTAMVIDVTLRKRSA